eukprot:379351-Alexandrium_andersonii.AAC.1
MSASLVGSEMCIRDSVSVARGRVHHQLAHEDRPSCGESLAVCPVAARALRGVVGAPQGSFRPALVQHCCPFGVVL